MKKTISMLLCFVMLFTLAACSSDLEGPASTGNTATDGTATAEEINTVFNTEGFCTGFARANITPQTSVPLGGYGTSDTRFSTNVLDPLCATVVAVSSGEKTALFISVDLLGVSDALYEQTTSMIQTATGIAPEYVFLCATHTHAAPDVGSADPGILIWKKLFYENVTTAVKEAIANLDRTEIYLGEARTDGLNFVRRYLLADGTYAFLNGAGSGAEVIGHETEADNEMQIIKFDRENQKDILMVNWQCHPTQAGGDSKPDISADYIAKFRETTEEDTGCHFSYYEGACGNVVAMSRIPEEMKASGYNDLGKKLAATLTAALGNLEKANGGEIKAVRTTLTADVDHSRDAEVEEGKRIAAQTSRTLSEVMQSQFGYSLVTAGKIISKASMGATAEIGVGAISIGDIAFIAAPYEMFDTNGMEVKDGSPFKMTFICEQTNGSWSYIPSAFAFPHGLYEVVSCRFLAGTGEKLVESFLTMLNSIK